MSGTGELNVDELLSEMAPREVTVRVLLRQGLLTDHARLERELELAVKGDQRENRTPLAPTISKQIVDLEDEIDAAKREFTFRSLGSRKWSDLLAKHPPTRDQKKNDPRAAFNDETFPVEAVAASSHSPKLTVDEAQAFQDGLPKLEWQALWQAAAQANLGGDDSPKSRAAGVILRQSGESANTAADVE